MVPEYEQGILFDPESSTAKSFSCSSCGLYDHVKSPRMEPYGKFRKGILNIGEAPGEVEDNRGKPWQGRAGQVLHRVYREVGIDLFEDCLNVNAVSCRPTSKTGSNRTPTDKEIQACKEMFLEYKDINRRLFVVCGVALQHYRNYGKRT
jgi:DNA polymerase